MDATAWYIIVGCLLVFMALAGSVVRRSPVSTALIYLAVGFVLGPSVAGLLVLDPLTDARWLERLTEVAVIVSLFTAGLKLRLPLRDSRWWVPLRLAFLSMTLTVAAIALIAVIGFGMPLGVAILLGAILAPTDPVLAADVQVTDTDDRDRLRIGLTAEAGLNDGTAFPFVLLGLGLLGLHDLGALGWRWLVIDVLWATFAGLGVGGLLGLLIGRLVLYLRRRHQEAVGLDEFLTLGLIALAYGVSLLLHAYGFLAVFAAGVALRWIERTHGGDEPAPVGPPGDAARATDDKQAPGYLAAAVLFFNEQIERIGEVAVVVVLGTLLSAGWFRPLAWWFVLLVFLLCRPVAVAAALVGSASSRTQRLLMAWFGVRGIGSLYYLSYAIGRGFRGPRAEEVTAVVLTVVATSIVVHGVSVTPLMDWYERRKRPSARSTCADRSR